MLARSCWSLYELTARLWLGRGRLVMKVRGWDSVRPSGFGTPPWTWPVGNRWQEIL